MEFEDVKVYFHKSIILSKNIHVYRKFKLPFLGTAYGIEGIRI